MITKDLEDNMKCLFCVSDYHLEMILLPFIKEEIDNSEIIILTEKDLSQTIEVLLKKVNISDEYKKKIMKLDWKGEKSIEEIQNILYCGKKINIIVNGEYSYIKFINNEIVINENINIINCFHIGDDDVDIDILSKKYKCILNSKKML